MKKRLWIITLFPEYFKPLENCGVVSRVFEELDVNFVQLRDYADSNYKSVDDTPYGGGPGMVIRADILKRALMEGVVAAGKYGENFRDKLDVIITSPAGKLWNHNLCEEFVTKYFAPQSEKDLVFICGRYEGVDQRFIDLYIDQELSIGDFILSGGEIATMAIVDSLVRFIPNILGNSKSAQSESFQESLLEAGQYTRPREFDGVEVPEVLTNGHHKKINAYNLEQSIMITKERRPDLYEKYTKRQKDINGK